MTIRKPKIAKNLIFAPLFLAIGAPNHKKKKLKVLRRKKRAGELDLDAAEAEIRDLGFLEGDMPQTDYRCPQCRRPVMEHSTECPHCHLLFEVGFLEYQCPGCHVILTKSMHFCPQCGVDLEHNNNNGGSQKSKITPPEFNGHGKTLGKMVSGFAKPPYPNGKNGQFNCPNCRNPVLGSTKACPECEVILENGVEIFSCPDCSGTVYAHTITCPKCGLNLDE